MNASVSIDHAERKPRVDAAAWLARYGTLVSLVILLIVFSIARSDVFPTVDNLLKYSRLILGTMAFGLTVCLMMGLFDLSIAALATLGGWWSRRRCWSIIPIRSTSSARDPRFLCRSPRRRSAINGIIVSHLGISAFIATLATGSIFTGAMLGGSDPARSSPGIPDEFMTIGQGMIFGAPNPVPDHARRRDRPMG